MEPFRHQLCQDCLHRFAIEPGKTIRGLDSILRGVGLHRPGQFVGVAEVIHFLEKTKPIRKRRAELLGVAVIDTLLSQHVEIPQQHGGNVVPVRQALGRQLHREGKQPIVSVARGVCAHDQCAGPSQIPESHRRRVGHFRAQNVGQVLAGLGVVKVTVVIDDEIEPELSGVILWRIAHALGTDFCEIDHRRHFRPHCLLVGDLAKVSLGELL